MRLVGKKALITGASRGIGLATAKTFLREGATVTIVSRKKENLDAAADQLGRPANLLIRTAHCGKMDLVQQMVNEAAEAMGGLDILVNNAGTNPQFGPIRFATEDQWDKTFALNVKGYFFAARTAIDWMEKAGGGSIINISSIAGIEPAAMMGFYSVSKAAVIQLTRSLASEWGPLKVRVNAVSPGLVKTKLSRALWENEEILKMALGQQSLSGMAEPEDIANAILYLATDDSRYVTGHTLVVDGGTIGK